MTLNTDYDIDTSSSDASRERRQYKRARVDLPAKIRVLKTGEASFKPVEKHMFNLSAGGICVEQPFDLKAGDILKIEFTLPEEDIIIRALVEVIWTKEVSGKLLAGGKYVAIKPEDIRILAAFVEKK